MDTRESHFTVRQSLATDMIELYALEYELGAGITRLAKTINYDIKLEPFEQRGGPTAMMTIKAAQRLADSLWDAGIRPSAGHGSAGQLGATEKHLSDMRGLVKHYTNTDL